MSDYLDKRVRVWEEQAEWLARFRRIAKLEAWQVVRSSIAENLRDSYETQMEDTWRIDLDLVDRKLQAEAGFSAVGARKWDE